jgi:hypothetical protein
MIIQINNYFYFIGIVGEYGSFSAVKKEGGPYRRPVLTLL